MLPRTTISLLGALAALLLATRATAAVVLVSNEKGSTINTLDTATGQKTIYLSGLDSPDGLVLGNDGSVYVTSFNGGTLNRITSPTTTTAIASGFTGAGAVAKDAGGTFYVPNFGTISGGGTSVGKVVPAGGGSYTTTVNFITGFTTPDGLAFDSHGVLYEADFNSNRINKLDISAATFTTFVPGTAGLSKPSAILFDAADNLYVANFGTTPTNGSVVKIDTNGNIVSTLVTGLNSPLGLLLDAAGSTFFVSSWNGNTVSRFALGGGAATVVGTGFTGPTHMIFAPVPEASSLVILLAGAGLLAARRARIRAKVAA